MPSAARTTDRTVHGGLVTSGSMDVLINGLPAARRGDAHSCPQHAGDPISGGSSTVLTNGRPTAFVGCGLMCSNPDLGSALKARWLELLNLQTFGKDPAGLREWQEETDVVFGLKDENENNPYFGLPLEAMMFALEAGRRLDAPPGVILALWAKEGKLSLVKSALQDGIPIAASDPETARTMARSRIYDEQFRLDNFTAYLLRAGDDGDNKPDPDWAKHEPAFLRAIEDLPQYDSESGEAMADAINQELTVTGTPGSYTVKPSNNFYTMTLELSYQYFDSLGSSSFPQMGGASPSVNFNYMQYNMGSDRFVEFLDYMINRFGNGISATDMEELALHSKISSDSDWAQARVNAIRFGQFIQAYDLLYAGISVPHDEIETGSPNVLIESD